LLLAARGAHTWARAAQTTQTVKISAHRFSFTPNEITVKVHEPVVLVFSSDDVTHGMHFDDLDINAVIAKGTGAEVRFTPEKAGDFVGHCAVFCGTGHGNMSLTIHVVE
jgi:cytochrome c oxidase subunit 2